jgi:hypothetical protein
MAGHGSRAVWHELSSRAQTPGPWVRIHSRLGCLVFVLCVCVQVEALRRADQPSKESNRLS